jgi:hypothetical protein
MNRYTFVVQVHPKGLSTLENLSTRERVQISGPGAIGPQIELWLAELGNSAAPAATPRQSEQGQSESTPE